MSPNTIDFYTNIELVVEMLGKHHACHKIQGETQNGLIAYRSYQRLTSKVPGSKFQGYNIYT